MCLPLTLLRFLLTLVPSLWDLPTVYMLSTQLKRNLCKVVAWHKLHDVPLIDNKDDWQKRLDILTARLVRYTGRAHSIASNGLEQLRTLRSVQQELL